MTDTQYHLNEALEQLRKQRNEVDEQIASLEKILTGGPTTEVKVWKSNTQGSAKLTTTNKPEVAAKTETTKRKPKWSKEAREAARERMRLYWEERRKAKAGAAKKSKTKAPAATKASAKATKATPKKKKAKKASRKAPAAQAPAQETPATE